MTHDGRATASTRPVTPMGATSRIKVGEGEVGLDVGLSAMEAKADPAVVARKKTSGRRKISPRP